MNDEADAANAAGSTGNVGIEGGTDANLFERMDENGDGFVSKDEYKRWLERQSEAAQPPSREPPGGWPPGGLPPGGGGSSDDRGGDGAGGGGGSSRLRLAAWLLACASLAVGTWALVRLASPHEVTHSVVAKLERRLAASRRAEGLVVLLVVLALVLIPLFLRRAWAALGSEVHALLELRGDVHTGGKVDLGKPSWNGRYALAVAIALAVASAVVVWRRLYALVMEDWLGEGGYGMVYRAKLAGQPVAVKVLRTQERAAHASFREEFGLLARCKHPHIVQVIGFRNFPTAIIMELCKESLYECLHVRAGPLQARRCLQEVASGLKYLHSMDVVHRDIKSRNVLLSEGLAGAKLADFGLARAVQHTAQFTGAAFRGTAHYTAPEALVLSNPVYSCKTDVFAFAVLAWEVGARRLPYKDTDQAVIISLVQDGKRESINAVGDQDLRLLIAHAWAPSPEDRPSAADLSLAMETLASQVWADLTTR